MPKKGTIHGHHAFVTTGSTYQLEDPNHFVWLGEFNGPFLNNAGEGSFMNGTAWRCPGINDVRDGKSLGGHGYCTISDADGDTAYLKWEADPSPAPGQLSGRSWWTGGTGKFAGIKGENHWEMAHQVMPSRPGEDGIIGFTNFTGEYELPDDTKS